MRLQKFLNEELDYDARRKLYWKLKSDCADFFEMEGASVYTDMWRGANKSSFKKTGNTVDLIPLSVRKDRHARDTKQSLHDLLDTGFKSCFGCKARSEALFCTGHKAEAKGYGTPYRIFPIGPVRCIYSPEIEDLTELDPVEMFNNLNVKRYPKVAAFILYFNLIQKTNLFESSINEMPMLKTKKSTFSIDSVNRLKEHNKEEFKAMFDYFNYKPNRNWLKSFGAVLEKEKENLVKSFVNHYYYEVKDLEKALNSRNEIMVVCNSYYAIPEDVKTWIY